MRYYDALADISDALSNRTAAFGPGAKELRMYNYTYSVRSTAVVNQSRRTTCQLKREPNISGHCDRLLPNNVVHRDRVMNIHELWWVDRVEATVCYHVTSFS